MTALCRHFIFGRTQNAGDFFLFNILNQKEKNE